MNKTKLFFLFIVFFLSLLLVSCSDPKQNEYSICGTVYDTNQPLSEAVIKYGNLETTTDANGKFTINSVIGIVKLECSKDGYVMEKSILYASSQKKEPAFYAYKKFDIVGFVMSNNLPVLNARVSANGIANASTLTNDQGYFVLTNLAGVTTVSAFKENILFLDKIVSDGEIQVNFDSNFTLNVTVSEGDKLLEGVEVTSKDKTALTDDKGFCTIINTSNPYELKLNKNGFIFGTPIIAMEDNVFTAKVEAYRLYNASLKVASGQVAIKDAKVILKFMDKTEVLYTNDKGYVNLQNLYGNVEIEVVKDGFTFKKETINFEISSLEIKGVFNMSGKVTVDGLPAGGVSIGYETQIVVSDELGNYNISNCNLSSFPTILDLNFVYELNKVNEFNIDIIVYQIYSVNGIISFNNSPLGGAKIKCNDLEIFSQADGTFKIDNLCNKQVLKISCDGFYFDEINVDCENANINITAQKIYSYRIQVRSGEYSFTDAIVKINGVAITLDSFGMASITNEHIDNYIIVEKSNYDTTNVLVTFLDDNKLIDIDLSYSIIGKVSTGKLPIQNVEVKCATASAITDINGNYTLSGLKGSGTITFVKDGYVFLNNMVMFDTPMQIDTNSSYTVSGYATNGGISIEGVKITIGSENYYTDENGFFTASGLIGECGAIAELKGYNFKPQYIFLYGYNTNIEFDSSAYEISGSIYCGDSPLANVKLSTGELVVYTDSNGIFKFDILKKACDIVIYKEGYSFSESVLSVAPIDEGTSIVVNCTYSISGVVVSNGLAVSMCEVDIAGKKTLTDNNGFYSINGLSGQNTVAFYKQGYKFSNETTVFEYSNNFNAEASYLVKGKVVNGNNTVTNVKISFNDIEVFSNADGFFEIYVSGRCSLILEKNLYTINSDIIFEKYEDKVYEFSSTYTLSGIAYSKDILLANAQITVNDKQTLSNNQGEFTINNIEGDVVVVCVKDGYTFDSVMLNQPEEISFNGYFDVTFNVKMGTKAISGARIICQTTEAVTDNDGNVTFKKLYGNNVFKIDKEGYTFTYKEIAFKQDTIAVRSFYRVNGVVKCGNNLVAGVVVQANNIVTTTDSEGLFTLEGLESSATISCVKTGYVIGSQIVSDYSDSVVQFDSTYSIEIKITEDNFALSKVKVLLTALDYSDTYYTDTDGRLVIFGLNNQIKLDFIMAGKDFSINTTTINSYKVLNLEAYTLFTVTAEVTAGGLPLTDMPIYIGGNVVTTTDTNGKFIIENLKGSPTIKGEYNNTSAKLNFTRIVNKNSTNISVEFDQNEYLFLLIDRGYGNLRNANSIHSNTVGEVNVGIGKNQQVRASRKRKGSVLITESINYGETILGIDPKVGLKVYYDLSTKELMHKKTKNVGSDCKPNYPVNWEHKTIEQHTSSLGSAPENLCNYIINKDTILGYSNISYSNEEFKFSVKLDASKSTVNYDKQMNYLSGQDPTFKDINLTFTIKANGFFKEIKAKENYKVSVASCEANLTETFLITDKDTVLIEELN